MRCLLVFILALVAACSPMSEPIEREPALHEFGQQGAVAVTLPLSWHASEHWDIDPLFGAAVRSNSCGAPEPYLRSLALEVDAASVPSASEILGATLVIDPCDEHPQLPDNLPAFALFSVDRFGIPIQLASAAQDQSTTSLAYNGMHEIHMPVETPVQVSREKNRYVILFEPEYGAGATGATRVLGLTMNVVLP